jgi:hypothetical protein
MGRVLRHAAEMDEKKGQGQSFHRIERSNVICYLAHKYRQSVPFRNAGQASDPDEANAV